MEASVLKWGNSLAVRLPKQVATEARFQQGDRIRLEVDEAGTVRIKHAFPTLDELISQITPQNRYSENEAGFAGTTGNEAVEW